jgi:hypothetical protein
MDLVLPVISGTDGYASLDLPLKLAPPSGGTFGLFGQWMVFAPGRIAGGVSQSLNWLHYY